MNRSLNQMILNGLAISLLVACNTPNPLVLTKKSGTSKDRSWIEEKVSQTFRKKVDIDTDKGLNAPVAISLPYRETSYFETTDPAATGYRFTVKKGEQVKVEINTNPSSGIQLYTELWEKTNEEPSLIGTADGVTHGLAYDIEKDGQYIVRLEPDAELDITYTITITTGPSLAFPINKSDKPRISSFWGASRDNGKRSHEGIDIMAKKHTPLLAVADGYITSVKNGGLGGKTVSLRPHGKNYSVYYAHLDEQYVYAGQYVKTGDTIGTVGNTGNAAKTAPHLHFGIYSNGGAVDPLSFVHSSMPEARNVKADTAHIRGTAKTKSTTSIYQLPGIASRKTLVQANLPVKILAASDNFFRVRMPDGQEGFIPSSAITKDLKKKQDMAGKITSKKEG